MASRFDDEIVVEGFWAVEAIVSARPESIREIVFEQSRHQELAALAQEIGISVRILDRTALREETGYSFHRGVYAIAERPRPQNPGEFFLKGAHRLVALAPLADPGNLGTVIRSAAALGAEGIMVPRDRGADAYSRKSIRASATALFRTPVFEVSSIEQQLMTLRADGWTVIAASTGEGAVPLAMARPGARTVLLFGSEEDGISPSLLEQSDETVEIPMAAGMDSLNVAATAAICCHHFFSDSAPRLAQESQEVAVEEG
ncbi:MAG: RNA methyltransferase [Verrucomicrobiota bacterium]